MRMVSNNNRKTFWIHFKVSKVLYQPKITVSIQNQNIGYTEIKCDEEKGEILQKFIKNKQWPLTYYRNSNEDINASIS